MAEMDTDLDSVGTADSSLSDSGVYLIDDNIEKRLQFKEQRLHQWLDNCCQMLPEMTAPKTAAQNYLSIEEVNRFQDILERNADGMSVTAFYDDYRKTYDYCVDTSHFNGSLIQLMLTCDHVFTLETIDDPYDQRLPREEPNRYLVFDARKRDKSLVPKRFKRRRPLAPPKPRGPAGYVLINYEIPTLPIGELFDQHFGGQIVAVYPTHETNGGKIWCQIIDDNNCYVKEFIALKQVMAAQAAEGCVPLPEMIQIGFHCAADCPYYGWIRVRVVDTSAGVTDRVRVQSIDFGHKFMANTSSKLRLLHVSWAELPALAVQLRLNGARKCSKRWKRVAAQLVHKYQLRSETNGLLFCQCLSFNGHFIDAILFETDDLFTYYSINDYIITKEVAVEDSDTRVEPDWEQLFQKVQQKYPNDITPNHCLTN